MPAVINRTCTHHLFQRSAYWYEKDGTSSLPRGQTHKEVLRGLPEQCKEGRALQAEHLELITKLDFYTWPCKIFQRLCEAVVDGYLSIAMQGFLASSYKAWAKKAK